MIDIFKSSFPRRDLRYFSILRRLENGGKYFKKDYVSHICIRHSEELQEDFEIRFNDLGEMNVPNWIATPLDLKIKNSDIEFYMQVELIDMCADLEAKF